MRRAVCTLAALALLALALGVTHLAFWTRAFPLVGAALLWIARALALAGGAARLAALPSSRPARGSNPRKDHQLLPRGQGGATREGDHA